MAVSFAAPCFSMGMRMLQVWRDPMAVDEGRWVRYGVGVFVLEFILLHASILLGAAATGHDGLSLARTALLVGFYALFAGAIALGFKSRALFNAFLVVVVGRFVAVMVGVSADDQRLFMAHSLVAMVLYFGLVISSVVLPWPKLGITEAVASRARPDNASGLWVEQPHRAIGPAAVYFLLLGVVELALMTWVDPRAIVPH